MAEEFQRRSDKGAVAVWASTGLGYASAHRVMMGAFYDTIFQDDGYGLGEATTEAKVAALSQNPTWSELVETFVLFGDPAQELGIPTNYPYPESTTPANGATDVPLDQDIQIVFSKSMNPATVQLTGPGTVGLTLSPSWNADYTVLTFDHTDFGDGETLSFTVEGQDQVGNEVGTGPVPNPWSFTTIYFRPGDVTVTGPTQGIPQTEYIFTANVGPDTVVTPLTYAWQAAGQTPVTHTDTGGGLSHTVSFSWTITGTHAITLTVSNDYGSAVDEHVINIRDVSNNTIYLPAVIKNY
jgi:hypothetical protein